MCNFENQKRQSDVKNDTPENNSSLFNKAEIINPFGPYPETGTSVVFRTTKKNITNFFRGTVMRNSFINISGKGNCLRVLVTRGDQSRIFDIPVIDMRITQKPEKKTK